MNVNNPTGAEPVPQSGFMMDNANASLSFIPGKTYRLRLINVSAFSMFYFSIDGHELDVIETDGVGIERTTVSSVYLSAAQRLSVLVKAKNDTSLNYYMHADMDTTMFDTVPDDLKPNISAPIYYDRSHSQFAPNQDVGNASTFDDINLRPLIRQDAVKPDHQLNLTFDFVVTTDGINRGFFNGVPYLSPKVPSLHTLLTEGDYALEPTVYGPQTAAYILNHLDMIEVIINNLDSNNHPFHLHGHSFQVVGRGDGVYDGTNKSVVWHLDNPLRRDTVVVPAGNFTIIRFRADNPGVWFFHCHIEWHLESGLAATFIEAPKVAQERMTLPQSLYDLCTASGMSPVGNAAGRQGLDLRGAPSGVTEIYDGFTAKGKGAMAGCIIAALLGIASIVLYAHADPERKAREIVQQSSQE
ncbi:ferroxidase fet3 [Apophysomyces ossiformis]|uniref:Ferroxidase fet3 n=1 Tax=Apophysomyces ossiformis TaxID=679940 RepID=A0A8H7ETZ8_9FUNG|nr:ferroxidase fet3 [Apophysomyces ossiformis]